MDFRHFGCKLRNILFETTCSIKDSKNDTKQTIKSSLLFYNEMRTLTDDTHRNVRQRIFKKTLLKCKKSMNNNKEPRWEGGGGTLAKNRSRVCASDKGTFFTSRKFRKGYEILKKEIESL